MGGLFSKIFHNHKKGEKKEMTLDEITQQIQALEQQKQQMQMQQQQAQAQQMQPQTDGLKEQVSEMQQAIALLTKMLAQGQQQAQPQPTQQQQGQQMQPQQQQGQQITPALNAELVNATTKYQQTGVLGNIGGGRPASKVYTIQDIQKLIK